MSSELRPQPAPQPESPGGSGSRRRRGSAGAPAVGAAALGRALGYDPDDPATWPGTRQAPAELAEPAAMPGELAEPAPESAQQESVTLTDPKAMRALAHPVRLALLELVGVAGTLTATQASEVLGESPANCAFHLRTLAKYGFVKETGGGRGRERPWTAAQRTISISSVNQKDPQAALAADALSQLWLDRWLERARRVYWTRNRVAGWERATTANRCSLFLTPDEAIQVSRELQQILDRFQDRERDPSLRPPGSMPAEVVFFTSPLTEYAGLNTQGETPSATPEQSQDMS